MFTILLLIFTFLLASHAEAFEELPLTVPNAPPAASELPLSSGTGSTIVKCEETDEIATLVDLTQQIKADEFNVSLYVRRGKAFLKGKYPGSARQDFDRALQLATRFRLQRDADALLGRARANQQLSASSSGYSSLLMFGNVLTDYSEAIIRSSEPDVIFAERGKLYRNLAAAAEAANQRAIKAVEYQIKPIADAQVAITTATEEQSEAEARLKEDTAEQKLASVDDDAKRVTSSQAKKLADDAERAADAADAADAVKKRRLAIRMHEKATLAETNLKKADEQLAVATKKINDATKAVEAKKKKTNEVNANVRQLRNAQIVSYQRAVESYDAAVNCLRMARDDFASAFRANPGCAEYDEQFNEVECELNDLLKNKPPTFAESLLAGAATAENDTMD